MPGRTPHAAYEAFIGPIVAATACLGPAKIVPSPGALSLTDREHSWSLNGPGSGMVFAGGVCFKASMKFEYIAHTEGWRVTTREYIYSLTVADVEIWKMHWHPVGVSHEVRPHLHAAIGGLGTIRDHLPMGRMAYEDAVEWAITHAGLSPVHEDWREILAASKEVHVRYRSWSGDGPVPQA